MSLYFEGWDIYFEGWGAVPQSGDSTTTVPAATRFRSSAYIWPTATQRRKGPSLADDDHEVLVILARFMDTLDEI